MLYDCVCRAHCVFLEYCKELYDLVHLAVCCIRDIYLLYKSPRKRLYWLEGVYSYRGLAICCNRFEVKWYDWVALELCSGLLHAQLNLHDCPWEYIKCYNVL